MELETIAGEKVSNFPFSDFPTATWSQYKSGKWTTISYGNICLAVWSFFYQPTLNSDIWSLHSVYLPNGFVFGNKTYIFCFNPCFDNFVGSCKSRIWSVVLFGPIMYQFKTSDPWNQHGSLNESCLQQTNSMFSLCVWASDSWGPELYLSISRSLFLDPFKGSLLYFLIQAQGWIIWEISWLWEDEHKKETQKITPSLFFLTYSIFIHQTQKSAVCVIVFLEPPRQYFMSHITSWLWDT